MCGICGILVREPTSLGDTIKVMTTTLAHRGPDGKGYAISQERLSFLKEDSPLLYGQTRCALGHRRLAIIDPVGGVQPMISRDGKIAILFNGEVYNFIEIKAELEEEGIKFYTNSDTEVILQLYMKYEDAPEYWLNRLNGMFAIAIWDEERQILLLARDHFGIKPLHYYQDAKRFLFASEIKAILAAGVPSCLNLKTLHLFLNLRYIPGEETLFKNIYRLPPAHYLIVKEGKIYNMQRYYTLPRENLLNLYTDYSSRLYEDILTSFHDAVARHLISDVPLGISLSGGLDSSMIVASAARSHREGKVERSADNIIRTFTLGFNEPSDENSDAKIVAEYFNTEHHDIKLTSNPLKDMEKVIYAVEEPKINIIQGYMLAQFVRKFVKVTLGGLGGDELFAGYDIHRFCNSLGKLHAIIPLLLQKSLFTPISSLIWKLQAKNSIRKWDFWRIGAQIALSIGDPVQFYLRLRNVWDFDDGMYAIIYRNPEDFRKLPRTREYFETFLSKHSKSSFLETVLRTEFHTKMVDDFLLNEDRVTSAHGLEGRVPFLDRKFVEFAFSIPVSLKMRGIETKYLWKKAIGNELPHQILKKKKHGFTFSSYHQWKKDLKASVIRELSKEWCRETDLFNYEFIAEILNYPAHPNLRWHYFLLWIILGLKEWMKIFRVTDMSF